MTISSKQQREEMDVNAYLPYLPRGPNATKLDIDYLSSGKSEVDELGIKKRDSFGDFTDEHKTFYHFVREKVKNAYNAYPGSTRFEEEVPSDLDTRFIQSVKNTVANELPIVFFVNNGVANRYQDHFPIHEMIKSYHRNKHARFLKT